MPFPLSLMKHALPDGLRAGEGFRHNGYDLSPLVDRHGFFQGMTYNRKHALVRTWTRPHQMLLKEIPRWQLQLDSRYMVLPTAHGTVISYHDLATLANKDGVVGTDLLFAAVTLVTQAPAHKAGLPPADSHRTTVCEPVYLYHGATAVEEWNTSILAEPVARYQRVYLIVHVPLHWLLVEIFPRQNKALLLDPLQTYGHQHLSLVTRLLTSWLTRLRASPWVIEHQRLPQQPAGSSMCGPFVTMYAACRRRDWEPPPQIDAAGLRRWMAEVLRDDAIPLHRGVCKHCGASLLRPGPDLLDNMGKCEPGCPPAADPDELLIIEPPTSAGHKRPAPGPDLATPDGPKKVQCTAASSPGTSTPLAAASRPRPGSARRRLELNPTYFATSPSPGPVAGVPPGVPPGVERSQLVVDGQRRSSRAVTNVDMMEADGDSAMPEAPASAGVAEDFGHDSGERAAAHLGADATASTFWTRQARKNALKHKRRSAKRDQGPA